MISLAAQQTIYLGANAKTQAICFALCFAVGLASGIAALLYFRKANPIERALTDLFATVIIGCAFLTCVEFFLDGKIELYGAIAFFTGVIVIPLVYKKIASVRRRKKRDPS